jgi:rsbT co-antagonist protein RsbR
LTQERIVRLSARLARRGARTFDDVDLISGSHMNSIAAGQYLKILQKNEAKLLQEWVKKQTSSHAYRPDLMKEGELVDESRQFLTLLLRTLTQTTSDDIAVGDWADIRDMLAQISRSRAVQGLTPSETATFVFSLKQALFKLFSEELESDPKALAEALWSTNELLDRLGLYTTEVFQTSREEVIVRQQRELLELSTPVVQLWDDILALPLVGTLDSARAQVVMETLLQKIVDTEAAIAIIDITGVPMVDTLVAQHLLKTIAATRLMGADCIISGIRPQIAQTIVHLGVDLGEVVTKATLADAFSVALKRTGCRISTSPTQS